MLMRPGAREPTPVSQPLRGAQQLCAHIFQEALEGFVRAVFERVLLEEINSRAPVRIDRTKKLAFEHIAHLTTESRRVKVVLFEAVHRP